MLRWSLADASGCVFSKYRDYVGSCSQFQNTLYVTIRTALFATHGRRADRPPKKNCARRRSLHRFNALLNERDLHVAKNLKRRPTGHAYCRPPGDEEIAYLTSISPRAVSFNAPIANHEPHRSDVKSAGRIGQ